MIQRIMMAVSDRFASTGGRGLLPDSHFGAVQLVAPDGHDGRPDGGPGGEDGDRPWSPPTLATTTFVPDIGARRRHRVDPRRPVGAVDDGGVGDRHHGCGRSRAGGVLMAAATVVVSMPSALHGLVCQRHLFDVLSGDRLDMGRRLGGGSSSSASHAPQPVRPTLRTSADAAAHRPPLRITGSPPASGPTATGQTAGCLSHRTRHRLAVLAQPARRTRLVGPARLAVRVVGRSRRGPGRAGRRGSPTRS